MEKSNQYQVVSIEVNRSQINLAGYNPRLIKPKARALLKANIKNNGLMGGLTWNKTTGNLIEGHQRVGILDELLNYPEKDYTLRVSVVELSDTQEKEQNIFLNNKNAQGEYDTAMLKDLLPEIDYKAAGLGDVDLKLMGIDIDAFKGIGDNIGADMDKQQKAAATKSPARPNGDNAKEPFVIISFESYDNKVAFMKGLGFGPDEKSIPGEALRLTYSGVPQ